MRFSDFDQRRYRTVGVREGYAEWVATYERTVQDAMDIALLERLSTVSWSSLSSAADLGCGTGRTGVWLKHRGVDVIDGVDLTPETLSVARGRGVYRQLLEADVSETGLAPSAYDLVICCLIDEHLAELTPTYREASRIADGGAQLVLVGYHPQFIMAAGMPTHFDSASGEPIAIDTYVHPISEHVASARDAGRQLAEMHERFIDDEWVALKPKWARHRGLPISFAFAWWKR